MPASHTIPSLLFADDLTGALECGALFAARGASALVLTQIPTQPLPRLDALILDTESRHLTPELAQATLRAAAAFAQSRQPSLLYKKTDSTLRGNIAPELRPL
ncbi:MAG: four-carbon acid sugar kinase family protein, partial [Acidobacteria bacterium]|nr:four-carbon acid sugar kinase family protein [Acidobacteriota bacterium]